MDDNILVIGIAGGTGSGKTTLMNNLISRFEGMVTVISHNNYYKRHDDDDLFRHDVDGLLRAVMDGKVVHRAFDGVSPAQFFQMIDHQAGVEGGRLVVIELAAFLVGHVVVALVVVVVADLPL